MQNHIDIVNNQLCIIDSCNPEKKYFSEKLESKTITW